MAQLSPSCRLSREANKDLNVEIATKKVVAMPRVKVPAENVRCLRVIGSALVVAGLLVSYRFSHVTLVTSNASIALNLAENRDLLRYASAK